MIANVSYNFVTTMRMEGDYYVDCNNLMMPWALNLFCPGECHMHFGFLAKFFVIFTNLSVKEDLINGGGIYSKQILQKNACYAGFNFCVCCISVKNSS